MRSTLRSCLQVLRASSAVQSMTSCRTLVSSMKTPDQHPWLEKVLAPSTLLPEERVMTFLAANVGAGNLAGVAQDWAHIPPQHHEKGLEVVLQAHAMAGFPRTINALMTIQKLGINTTGIEKSDEKYDLKSWREDGQKTLEAVYGSVANKMRANFKQMHPLLEAIMVEHIYGRILSRPQVTLRMRELCSVSILVGQNVPLQLVSHIRGSLRCGATWKEVHAVIEQTGLACGPEALEQARIVRDNWWIKQQEKKAAAAAAAAGVTVEVSKAAGKVAAAAASA